MFLCARFSSQNSTITRFRQIYSFVDLCADYGTPDEAFRDALGSDNELDKAITYYLDEEMEEDDWAEDEDF